jgi:hypothetical protein
LFQEFAVGEVGDDGGLGHGGSPTSRVMNSIRNAPLRVTAKR